MDTGISRTRGPARDMSRDNNSYIPDADRLSQPMGQYMVWHQKLFRFASDSVGWRFVKDIS